MECEAAAPSLTGENDTAVAHLAHAASVWPTSPALACGDQVVTFADWWRQSLRIAGGLARSVAAGGRVLVCMRNSIDMAGALFAVWRLGACCVILGPDASQGQIEHVVRLATPSLAIVDEDSSLALPAPRPPVPSITVRELSSSPASPLPRSLPKGDDLAVIVCTSGSTGPPKAVAHRHSATVRGRRALGTFLGLSLDERLLASAPWGFFFGLQSLVHGPMSRSTIIIPESASTESLCQAFSRWKPSVFIATPGVYGWLLHGFSGFRNQDLTRTHTFLSAGAAWPSADCAAILDLAPSAQIASYYGMTELPVVSAVRGRILVEQPSVVGRPLEGMVVHVWDEERGEVPAGAVGELVVESDRACLGYWGDQAATDRLLRPLRGSEAMGAARPLVVHTGDLGWRDEQGLLHVVGRKDRLVKCRGVRVNPAEIEAALTQAGLACAAGVVAVTHPYLEHELCVAIVPSTSSPNLAREAKEHLSRVLPREALPTRYLVLDSLPRTNRGKIDYASLTRLFSGVPA